MKYLRSLGDEELLRLLACGQSDCMAVLVERYRTGLMNYIRRHVGYADADDIFQDVCLRVLVSVGGGRYSEDGKFAQWVFRIARNSIVDLYRQRQSRQRLFVPCDDCRLLENVSSDCGEESVEDEIVRRQLHREVGEMIKRLPKPQQRVIEMKHYRGMLFNEIAEETGVCLNTALGQMRYGIMNLRRMMSSKENFSYIARR